MCLQAKFTTSPFGVTREVCLQAKGTRSLIEPSMQALHRIHTSVCGPNEPDSLGNAKYALTVLDDSTDYVVVIPIQKKRDVKAKLPAIIDAWEISNGFEAK